MRRSETLSNKNYYASRSSAISPPAMQEVESSERYMLYIGFLDNGIYAKRKLQPFKAEVNRQLKSHGIYDFYYFRKNQADYQMFQFHYVN